MNRYRALVSLGVMLLGIASAGPAFAQAPAAPPPPPKHEGSAEFALVGTSGNTTTRTVGLGGDLTLRPN